MVLYAYGLVRTTRTSRTNEHNQSDIFLFVSFPAFSGFIASAEFLDIFKHVSYEMAALNRALSMCAAWVKFKISKSVCDQSLILFHKVKPLFFSLWRSPAP